MEKRKVEELIDTILRHYADDVFKKVIAHELANSGGGKLINGGAWGWMIELPSGKLVDKFDDDCPLSESSIALLEMEIENVKFPLYCYMEGKGD